MGNKYYFVCNHCKKREAEYVFIDRVTTWWLEDIVGIPVCKKCRLYEKLRLMGENVSTRIAILTLNKIRYIGQQENDLHYITVKEDKHLHSVRGIIKRRK